MELEEREAKVCRLCGQFERLYIDVFGEEGMRRYLSVKIHSKINIMIDEMDPLPKAICVQCLGKLEFVCDFQEECLRTQHELRDRYNLPPLTEFEVKNEDAPPARSTDNNNSIEKNLNSTSGEDSEQQQQQQQQQQRVLRRSLRSQQQAKSNDEISVEENSQSSQSIQSTELTPSRWLRRRHNVDSTTSSVANNSEEIEEIPIASRLRSHNNNADNSNQANAFSLSVSNSDNESATGKNVIHDPTQSTIQLPTSALNKLLTLVSGAPDIEVSVKESRNRSGGGGDGIGSNASNSSSNDAEDISFTVELCRKSSEDDALPELKVRARVFPDQGCCLVDSAIVDLLQNSQNTTVEMNGIVNSILGSTGKNNGVASSKLLKDLEELEQMTEAMQKPEELFRVDGEEIKVDDNVEHVTNDGQNGYACKLCHKFYERRDKCTVHVKTHLGIKQYTCVVCNAKFVCKSDVMKHIRCSHTNPRPVQCPKCPKRFKSKFYLTEHDNVHKGVRPYSCTDCGQSYHHKVSLQIHMKSHLPPQNLACEYCGKVFPYRTRLLSHIASVHLKKRRNFRCRFCYNLYSSLAVLNEHIKTRHATTHTCGICGKTFKVTSKFKAHVMQHSNPKPFVCGICNNRYASKAFLNEHVLKHEGLRKHKCKTCNATFAQASHLAAHRHVHGEKTHACPECGRKFNRRDNMKVHRKRHFEQKKSGKQKITTTASSVVDSVAATTATNEK
ncbi:PREDICTED: zinc finger protein 37-like [Dinoponera quadriceps]|uniref:Zinc finger protein 37-like n=1 Tax=Dinoponera quadriceps TaxID=609295 RepID=A0A6P3X748_DINQU|nr:PREDICTED: zinc finger protein 37-like [Dinoponera quadriceps]